MTDSVFTQSHDGDGKPLGDPKAVLPPTINSAVDIEAQSSIDNFGVAGLDEWTDVRSDQLQIMVVAAKVQINGVDLMTHPVNSPPPRSSVGEDLEYLYAQQQRVARLRRHAEQQRVARSCWPLVTDPATVEPIWRELAARAKTMGLSPPAEIETTADPGLHVVIGGQEIKPIRPDSGRYTFVLPQTDSPIRLVSRAVRPTDARPWLDDPRLLGVAVSRLTLKRSADVEPIQLDHPLLSHGWWGVERDRATLWRWTDGDAVVPMSGVGPAVLEITLIGSQEYPLC